MLILLALACAARADDIQTTNATVADAQSLQAAISAQTNLIRITSHLDLTQLPGGPTLTVPTLTISPSTGSNWMAIWGECQPPYPADFPSEFVASLAPGTCVIQAGSFATTGNFSLSAPALQGRVMMSSLAFYRPTNAAAGGGFSARSGGMWLVGLVMVNMVESTFVMESTNFNLMNSIVSSAGARLGSTAGSAIDCFEDPTLANSAAQRRVYVANSILELDAAPVVTLVPGGQQTLVAIGNTTFAQPVVAAGATCTDVCVDFAGAQGLSIYVDPNVQVGAFNASAAAPQGTPNDLAALTFNASQPSSSDASWIAELYHNNVPGVAICLNPFGKADPNWVNSVLNITVVHVSGSSLSGGAIAGIVIGAAAGAALIAALLVFLLLRRRKQSDARLDSYPPANGDKLFAQQGYASGYAPSAYGSTGYGSNGYGYADGKVLGQPGESDSSWGTSQASAANVYRYKITVASGSASETVTNAATLGSLLTNAPGEGGPGMNGPMGALQAQLDAIIAAGGAFLGGRYRLLRGPQERRAGGQGVVQFAALANNPNMLYAIKFFLSKPEFDLESSYYFNETYRAILPPVDNLESNEAGAHVDPSGRPLPPFIVLEKGESLDEFIMRSKRADLGNCIQVIMHVVERVAFVHEAGLVHRDIKPSNTLLLKSRNIWTLIDFGSAAQHGTTARLTLTMGYAAPETVAAFLREDRTVVADFAVDIWSVGIMAFELFTHRRVFTGDTTAAIAMFNNNTPFPWEDTESPTYAADMKSLGFMKSAILKMLSRDPADRPPLGEVHRKWQSILQTQSTFTAV